MVGGFLTRLNPRISPANQGFKKVGKHNCARATGQVQLEVPFWQHECRIKFDLDDA
jgi:hypothetical protein